VSTLTAIRRTGSEFLSAMQFLTRIPLPSLVYEEDSLARAVKFFPAVGALIGYAAALLHRALAPHLSRPLTAIAVLTFLVLLTGALHEDGLADSADGFGGGHTRDKVLLIMRDSRIGTYGAVALVLSLVGRMFLLAAIPLDHVLLYLIAAHVLSRWTALPLSYFLPAARQQDGQGARVARLTSSASLIVGTIFSFCLVGYMLRFQAIAPVTAAIVFTALSAWFYQHRIGGITGDCFGATNQLTELVIYLCGAWIA
jgi:adenosylcobinamide-GDP ribazoletransferase